MTSPVELLEGDPVHRICRLLTAASAPTGGARAVAPAPAQRDHGDRHGRGGCEHGAERHEAASSARPRGLRPLDGGGFWLSRRLLLRFWEG
jgi:hypothetical protein